MFDTIARRYDRLNHLLSLGIDRSWRRRVVGRVRAQGAGRVLDAATGTGDLAILMARKCSEMRVDGIDLSENMLAIGRTKIERAGVQDRVALIQGDAEAIDAPDSYDAVTAAFGVRNFADIPAGLAEFHRVLRPGGKAYVLEFGRPKRGLFGWLYRFYFHGVLPVIGRLVSRDREAYSYLPRSVDTFPYGEPFLTLMREAGFANCSLKNLTFGVAQLYEGTKPGSGAQ